jgi:hypothetical protein
VGVAVTVLALLLSHYWALYLLAVVGIGLLLRARRMADRRSALATLGAIVAGALLWLPWFPSFWDQFQHTGTPWAAAPPFGSIFTAVTFWAGGPLRAGPLLGLLFFGLVVLALFGFATAGGIELRTPARAETKTLALVVFLTLVVAYVAGVIGHSTFADRYTSIVWPLFVLLVATGLAAIGSARVGSVVVLAIVGLGLFNSLGNVTLLRTQAGKVARVIDAGAQPGDVVVFCPDQLGPAVVRLLDAPVKRSAYPTGGDGRFVDWIDYEDRNRSSDPSAFLQTIEEQAGDAGSIWLVSSPGYRTFGTKCQRLKARLLVERPDGEILVRRKPKSRSYEREELSVFPPG